MTSVDLMWNVFLVNVGEVKPPPVDLYLVTINSETRDSAARLKGAGPPGDISEFKTRTRPSVIPDVYVDSLVCCSFFFLKGNTDVALNKSTCRFSFLVVDPGD